MTLEPLKYPQVAPSKITEAIAFATKAYEETLHECLRSGMKDQEAMQVAVMSWRCCLPVLEDIDSIKAFIACIATGQARRWLPSEDAKALTYTAQLALTAWQENHKGRKCYYPKGRYA